MQELFRAARLGEIEIGNRVVAAPMVRARADAAGRQPPEAAAYYAQRATAGLVVTEPVNVGPMSRAHEMTPGFWTSDQIDAWRPVVDAVHAKGGKIALLLSHAGRIGARDVLGRAPMAPSRSEDDPSRLDVYVVGSDCAHRRVPATPADAMTPADIAEAVEQFERAARQARALGLDALEIEASDGHLVQQFLSSRVNRRGDGFGGGPRERCTFLIEILRAVGREFPLSRVGVRWSSLDDVDGNSDPEEETVVGLLASIFKDFGVAYLHLARTEDPQTVSRTWRECGLKIIGETSLLPDECRVARALSDFDAISFTLPFVANPDLVYRAGIGGPYNGMKHEGLMGGGAYGYLDYLTLEEEEPADVGLA